MDLRGHNRLEQLPVASIRPTGWLRRYLEAQRDGLTGRKEHSGFPFDTCGWAGPIVPPRGGLGSDWWPYEQTGYWVDGAVRCGILLDDNALTASARSHLEYALSQQDADGYLGPPHLKESSANNLWPHAVLWRAYMALAGSDQDTDTVLLPALHRFARFLVDSGRLAGSGNTDGDQFGLGFRDILNLEGVVFAARVVGDSDLLATASRLFPFADTGWPRNPDIVPSGHGVSYMESLKLPILAYSVSGDDSALEYVRDRYRALDYHHMLGDGVPSSCEHLSGREANGVHETCVIADYSWTTGYMLRATGEVEWADRIERAVLNAGIGCVNPNFTAHQYYSGPNQVVADRNASHWNADVDWFDQSRPRMAYQPGHDTECCTGNLHRILPNYCAMMWAAVPADSTSETPHGGLAAVLFGPSRVRIRVDGENLVTVEEATDFPFDGTVRFTMRTAKPLPFAFWVRIPGWAEGASVLLNGRPAAGTVLGEEQAGDIGAPPAGAFFVITRTFEDGDEVLLTLPMRTRVEPQPYDGAVVTRGPLVFSLPVPAETTTRDVPARSTKAMPGYEMRPAGRWQYALDLPDGDVESMVSVARTRAAVSTDGATSPWTPETSPVRITVPAKEIRYWDIVRGHTPGLPSPVVVEDATSGASDTIELVPLGATTLRLSVFPRVR